MAHANFKNKLILCMNVIQNIKIVSVQKTATKKC